MTAKLALESVAVDRLALIEGRLRAQRIVSGVNCSVPAGGRLAMIGPSGAGKSSLLRLLNRLDDPAEGRVLLDGTDLRSLDPIALRRHVGMVFQQPFLFDLTVQENLAYPLRMDKRDMPREQAVGLLAEFDLAEDMLERRGPQLSGGQQQRIALARALVLEPELLLLDEPTSALDEESARVMMDALLRRNRDGLTLVMVTHSPEILHRLDCPTLLVHDGRVTLFPDVESALHETAREQIRME